MLLFVQLGWISSQLTHVVWVNRRVVLREDIGVGYRDLYPGAVLYSSEPKEVSCTTFSARRGWRHRSRRKAGACEFTPSSKIKRSHTASVFKSQALLSRFIPAGT